MPPGDSSKSMYKGDGTVTQPDAVLQQESKILKMDDTSDVEDSVLMNEVRYWKSLADDLKTAGYPVYVEPGGDQHFSPAIREKSRKLNEFLDALLGDVTDGTLNGDAVYQKLRLLMAQGQTLEEFTKLMDDLDYSAKCNSIWENDAVAYRCNTCALTPCMSLCANCFANGDHKDHDFTRFFSREGGACDCGNGDVLKESGFCVRHGTNTVPRPLPDANVVSLPEFIICRLVVRLFCRYRGWSRGLDEFCQKEEGRLASEVRVQIEYSEKLSTETSKIILFLQELVNLGGPLRDAFSKILLDKNLYTMLNKRKPEDELEAVGRPDISLDWRTRGLLERDKESVLDREVLARHFMLSPNIMNFECLLDELVFWIIRLIFPQSLINLSLGMLCDNPYRDAFSDRFFILYPCSVHLMRQLCTGPTTAGQVGNIACRIIHISVQMLSSEALCNRLSDAVNLVETVFSGTRFLLLDGLTKSKMSMAPIYRNVRLETGLEMIANNWDVIDTNANPVFTQHGYWFVMGDTQNLLSHRSIACRVIQNEYAFQNCYMTVIRCMQGMNYIQRIITGQHREVDTADGFQRAYTLEFEISATSVFNMVTSVATEGNGNIAVTFFSSIRTALRDWFKSLEYARTFTTQSCPPFSVTFHLPLHRHLASCISNFHDLEEMKPHLEELRNDKEFLKKLILHPMRIQVARIEYHSGMWVRNGNQMRMQAIVYTQQHLNSSFIMPDLDIMRFCASNISPNWVWECVLESYHLYDIFEWSTRPRPKPYHLTTKPATRVSYPLKFRVVEVEEAMEVVEPEPQVPAVAPIVNVDVVGLHDEQIEVAVAATEDMGESMEQGDTAVVQQQSAPQPVHVSVASSSSTTGTFIITGVNDHYMNYLDEEGNIKETPETLLSVPDPHDRFSEVIYRGVNHAEVLTRPEWIDPMVQGGLRMIAECIVLRGTAGNTPEGIVLAELVHQLSIDDQPYSRLKSAVPEKTTDAKGFMENTFNKILNEVAEFREPDQGDQIRQGVYRLRPEAWEKYFCPVFLQVRAPTTRLANLVMVKVEKMDQDKLDKLNKDKLSKVDKEKKEGETRAGKLWIPYRLINFAAEDCPETHRNAARLLTSDRYFEVCAIVIRGFTCTPFVLEGSVQLAIYLLSLGVRHAITLPDRERERVLRKYHFEWNYRKHDGTTGKMSIFTVVHALFAQLLPEKKDYVVKMKEQMALPNPDRIIGTGADYVARFLNLLYQHDFRSRFLLDKVMMESAEAIPAMDEMDEQKKRVEAARLAAKKKRESIMAKLQKKNANTMKLIMDKEGVSQTELDAMDTTQPSVRLYECPICTDSTPSTEKQPLGLLVSVVDNDIVGQQLSAAEPDMTLMALDDITGVAGLPSERNSYRTWQVARMEITNKLGDLVECYSSVEVKTCGHYAHISCFTAYRNTLQPADVSAAVLEQLRVETLCPTCRSPVNAQVPVPFDLGFEIETTQPGTMDEGEEGVESVREDILSAIRGQSVQLPGPDDISVFHRHHTKEMLAVLSRGLSMLPSISMMAEVNQNLIAAVIKAHTERDNLYVQAGCEERRKSTRGIVVDHLFPALVAYTTPADQKALFCVVRDLLTPEYLLPSTSTVDPKASSSMDPVTLANIDDLKEFMEDLTSKPLVDNVVQVLKEKSTIPLLAYEPKGILVKVTAFVTQHPTYTAEKKLKLLRQFACALTQALLVKTTVQMLVGGCTIDTVPMIGLGHVEMCIGMPAVRIDYPLIAKSLVESKPYYDMSWFASDIQYPMDFDCNLDLVRDDFLAFVNRLWLYAHVLSDEVVAKQKTSADVQRDVLGDLTLVSCREIYPAWVRELAPVIAMGQATHCKAFFREPIHYRRFGILGLPGVFDDLFSRYFSRNCLYCGTCPSNPFVCLLCSQLVCIEDCCRTTASETHMGGSEIERHATVCGSGVCPFISITSSLVVVVKHKKGLIWGTVYLDAHGEEDRNLRRGKPLYLSDKRVESLTKDWIEQDWSRSYSVWAPLEQMMALLRDSHHSYR